jgi:RNA polymerase sigma-70 factor (ECF subfamily)
MMMVPDQVLITELQAGSLEALGLLYDRHQRVVYRTALAVTGDPEAASDLLQDVFLRLHRFADRVDPERPLEPWLYRVTANLSYTWVKRRNRWIRPLTDIAEWLTGGKKFSPSQQVEENDVWEPVRQAVLSLPLSHRVIMVMYYINDLPLQEIAEILDIPVGTVKSRLFYGRQALKERLGLLQGEKIAGIQYEFT